MTPAELERTACEAAHLLNEAITELLIPQHLFELFTSLSERGRASERYAAAMRRTALRGAIISVYRLRETREHFLRFLFSADELNGLGFPNLEQLVQDWKAFEVVRHQYAGHSTARKSTAISPGRLLAPRKLGDCLGRTGLWDADSFLRRVRQTVVPGVEQVRTRLLERYPTARPYIEGGYASEVQESAEAAIPRATSDASDSPA
jgi:hypothetical protein